MKLNMEIGLACGVRYVILISEYKVIGQTDMVKELYVTVHHVKAQPMKKER